MALFRAVERNIRSVCLLDNCAPKGGFMSTVSHFLVMFAIVELIKVMERLCACENSWAICRACASMSIAQTFFAPRRAAPIAKIPVPHP